jgi:hydrogenase-4 component B
MSAALATLAIAVAALSGLPGLFAARAGRAGERLFTALVTVAGVAACAAGALGLAAADPRPLDAAWSVPGGRVLIHVDALSALFLLPIALVTTLGAWYGLAYFAQREHPRDGRKLRAFYGLATAGMMLLVVAHNAILFLFGWELMALAAFMLVATEDDRAAAREVGYVYLVTTHAGTLCVFATFALLGAAAGTLDFSGFGPALASPLRDAIFVLALCGFGLKAGVMPLHVWLPGAHATAPSHVSAVMSGVLIKTGIYGLVRVTGFCDAPPLGWGYTLIALGVLSAVLGVAFAIGQHDLKRLLAYHSVENIGIICLGLGVALIGRAGARPELVVLGLGGALLHVWNHGLFKALLFLSGGAVVHATGTREIDRLGGLMRRMPRTGAAFLVGAVAICGLPPLNGLVSELLVYLGLFGAGSAGPGPWIAGAMAAPALALVAALALACFVKVFGALFLGEPRSAAGAAAHDPPPPMLVPMAILGAACLLVGLGAPLCAPALDAAARAWSGGRALPPLAAAAPLGAVAATSAALLAAVAAAVALLARARARAAVAVTWDCGYAAPAPRMQYTASSFAGGLVALFAWALRPQAHAPRIAVPFPRRARFESHLPDTVLDRALTPGFHLVARIFRWMRPIQHGSVHVYLLYILGALLALLLWSC